MCAFNQFWQSSVAEIESRQYFRPITNLSTLDRQVRKTFDRCIDELAWKPATPRVALVSVARGIAAQAPLKTAAQTGVATSRFTSDSFLLSRTLSLSLSLSLYDNVYHASEKPANFCGVALTSQKKAKRHYHTVGESSSNCTSDLEDYVWSWRSSKLLTIFSRALDKRRYRVPYWRTSLSSSV